MRETVAWASSRHDEFLLVAAAKADHGGPSFFRHAPLPSPDGSRHLDRFRHPFARA